MFFSLLRGRELFLSPGKCEVWEFLLRCLENCWKRIILALGSLSRGHLTEPRNYCCSTESTKFSLVKQLKSATPLLFLVFNDHLYSQYPLSSHNINCKTVGSAVTRTSATCFSLKRILWLRFPTPIFGLKSYFVSEQEYISSPYFKKPEKKNKKLNFSGERQEAF